MPTSQTLFDTLAGAAGHPVNRPAMDAYVTQGQAMSGLRTAQTEEALLKAETASSELDARSQTEGLLGELFGPGREAEAKVASNVMNAGFGNAQTALDALKSNLELGNRHVLSDPSQLGTPAQTAAMQGVEGKVADPIAVAQEFTTRPGAYQPNVQQTPEGAARTGLLGAQSTMNVAKANKDNAAASGASSISDDAAYNAAVRYNMTGNLPALGMNSGLDRRKVLEFAANISVNPDWQPQSWNQPAAPQPGAAPGGTPGAVPLAPGPQAHPTPATAIAPVGHAATTKANTSTLMDLTKRTALVDASEQTANDNLGLALQMAQKADQSGVPLWNSIQNKIRQGILGDPDVSAYVNALTTASNEYARVISMATGAAGITDAARDEGHRLFNTSIAPDQLASNYKVAQQEMANRTASMHDQIATTKKALYTPPGGGGVTPPAAAAPGVASAAGGFTEGQTATNPTTGAKVVYRGGQWLPQ